MQKDNRSASPSPLQDRTGSVGGSWNHAEHLLSSIIESSDDAILSKDLNGVITSWNKGAERLFGYTAEEAVGQPVYILIPEDRRNEEPGILDRIRRGIPVEHYETMRRRKDGKLLDISLTVSPVLDGSGNVIGASKIARDITDRKQAERTRRLLSAIVESSDDAIASKDLDGIITSWNKGAEQLLGYKAEEIIGKPVTTIIPEERLDEEPKIIGNIRRGVRVDHLQTVRRRKDGKLIDVALTVSPIRDESGKVIGASKILRDITERKVAEEKLRQTEGELRTFANSIPNLAWIAEPHGEVVWYNRRWYEYTGTAPDQTQGWGWQSVHDPKVLPVVIERWKQSLATGETFEMEFPLRGADGQFRWFLTRIIPARDAAGKITRWFGTGTDVDTVRKTQEALREETRILELLNDTGAAIAAQLDLQVLVQNVTDAATKMCGAKFGAFFYNVINAQGESFLLYTLSGAPREAFEKFGMPRNTAVFHTTFSGAGVMRSDDITKDHRYGKLGPHFGMPKGHLPVCSYLAVPVISRSGEVIGGLFFGHPEPGIFTEKSERLVVGVAAQAAIAIDNARLFESAQREIAVRKKVEEELRKAQEELNRHAGSLEKEVEARTASLREAISQLEEFSYSVSHDLRAPLRAITGYAEVFGKDYKASLPPQAHAYLEKITRNAARMQRLIDEVLTISRLGREQIELHEIDLQRSIAEIVEQHSQLQAPAASITIDAPHKVIGDEASLGQVISNLLMNAVKFVEPGRKPVVVARSETHGDRTRLWIEDNGIGIKPEHRSKLFGMFQRLTADARYEGTGIGLAIVRKAAERMGGTVGAEPGANGGSRFWVELKAAT